MKSKIILNYKSKWQKSEQEVLKFRCGTILQQHRKTRMEIPSNTNFTMFALMRHAVLTEKRNRG